MYKTKYTISRDSARNPARVHQHESTTAINGHEELFAVRLRNARHEART